MDLGVTVLDTFSSASAFLFPFWPLFLLATLRYPTNLLRKMIVMWVILLIVRMVLFSSPDLMLGFIIKEPLNTLLFGISGFILAVFYIANIIKSGRST